MQTFRCILEVGYLGNGDSYVSGVSQTHSQLSLGLLFKENPASIRPAVFLIIDPIALIFQHLNNFFVDYTLSPNCSQILLKILMSQ